MKFLQRYNHLKQRSLVTSLVLSSSASLVLCLGCQKEESPSSAHLEQDVRVEEPKTSEEQLQELASAFNLKAYSAEEKVTRLLQEMATKQQASLKGLEHRLKTKSSTLRKLKKMHSDAPHLPLNELKIRDALRYTVEISDEPAGHYVSAVSSFLKALEAKGHKVVQVKNYWPKGDNYSGVNTVLMTPQGLEWELQFHTPASYKESKQSHVKYEKLRAVDTPLTERQKLFTEMAAPWEEISIPQGVLTPKNLHQSEEIKQWSAPK